jgi:hypothetical protein
MEKIILHSKTLHLPVLQRKEILVQNLFRVQQFFPRYSSSPCTPWNPQEVSLPCAKSRQLFYLQKNAIFGMAAKRSHETLSLVPTCNNTLAENIAIGCFFL